MQSRSLVAEVREAFASRPREVLVLLALAALTIASYGFARPAIESLFLGRYGHQGLPWAWLAVGVAAIVVTALYNRVVTSTPLTRLWPLAVAAMIAPALLLFGLLSAGVDHVEFVLYVWKDLYIVVLVELFWSIANVRFSLKSAKWVYGMFLAAGSLGGLCAELAVGPLASELGSLGAASLSIPVLLTTVGLILLLPPSEPSKAVRSGLIAVVKNGVSVLRKSRYLLLLVALVGLVQIALTVIDYQFNAALEAYAPDVDERTGLSGRIYATISAASLALQLLAGVVIKGLGIPIVIALSPLLLLCGTVAFAVHPRFGVMAAVKVASKALDYSLGRAAKELLYIPLSYAEKTEGKAIVDLLSYRVAKGFASALLLWLGAAKLGGMTVTAALLALLAGWLMVAVVLGRRFGE